MISCFSRVGNAQPRTGNHVISLLRSRRSLSAQSKGTAFLHAVECEKVIADLNLSLCVIESATNGALIRDENLLAQLLVQPQPRILIFCSSDLANFCSYI